MNYSNNHDPLHGVTLKTILTRLQEKYGWQGLADHIRINCFSHDPSIQSSLKFLRKTPWARKKVENLYVRTKWPAAIAEDSEKMVRTKDTKTTKNIKTVTDVKPVTGVKTSSADTKTESPWATATKKRNENN